MRIFVLAVWVATLACFSFSNDSAAKPGDQFKLLSTDLPAPNTTAPTDLHPRYYNPAPGFVPQVPPGFSISAFASPRDVKDPRWLTVAPNGDVFVAESYAGKILVLRDNAGVGKADTVSIFADQMDKPHGMFFYQGGLYVADLRAIWRFAYRDGDLVSGAAPIRVTQSVDLKYGGFHWTREIAIDSKGHIYLAIGARGDALEAPSPDATIQQVDPNGQMTTFASGLRNVVGMAFYPGTDELWGTVNERDRLGGELPPDYLAHIRRDGFYGWPYAYIGPHADPIFGIKRPDLVAKTAVPDLLFEPHSAPLGLAFYDGTQFPAEYKGDAFVAFHASGPYGKVDGYKVVRVKFLSGKPTGGYEDFMTGWWAEGGKAANGVPSPIVFGTPAGVAVAKDGSLLVSDEHTVWRVTFSGRHN